MERAPILTTIFVKMPEEGRTDGYCRFYALDWYADGQLTAWPLPSFGLPIGSVGREWPDGLRVVRKAKELRQCAEWQRLAERHIPRMTFACSRLADGTIRVQNMVGPMLGQLHTHDTEDFARWKAGAMESGSRESDFVWSE